MFLQIVQENALKYTKLMHFEKCLDYGVPTRDK